MIDFYEKSSKSSSWFLWLFKGILVICFLIVLGRVIDLQVIKGAYYKSLSEGNRVRRVPILAPRGEIIAEEGEVLAGVEEKQVNENENSKEIIVQWKRTYAGVAFGHITGYLGLAKEGEAGKVRGECSEKGTRKIGSFVGRSGLEEQYDCSLSGIDGEELVEVDAMGEKIRSLGRREPIQGETLHTSIDYGLQKKSAEILNRKEEDEKNIKKGAVVAMRPTGEILAFYSSPSYDPSVFVQNENDALIANVLQDKNLPLFNRAIGGMFHPGSVYKPLVALAALEEGAITKDYSYDDRGLITVETNYGDFSYKNWYFTQYGGKEGAIDVRRALARSTDTFFYEIGNMLTVRKLESWSHTFGLDEKTGIDIPGEIAGLVPSPEWKLKVKGEQWFLGNTYHMAIGQGDLAVTPLAMNVATSAIANNGTLCAPKFVNGDETQCKNLDVKNEHIKVVIEGMEMACASGGTAFPFFDFELPDYRKVACKTGTAETEGGDDGDTHAWFTIFAPSDNPEVVMTILVERGGEGSRVAAPIARELLDYWFYEKHGKEVPKKVTPTSATPSIAIE